MGTRAGVVMLNDAVLRNLKPAAKAYQRADAGGLFIDVLPGGSMVWRLRYRVGGRDVAQEKVTLGEYPSHTLAEARLWRDEAKALVERGVSPAALKRGESIPAGASPVVRELAEVFISRWCGEQARRIRAQAVASLADTVVEAFAQRWFDEVVTPSNADPRNIQRALAKDILPVMGHKQMADVTTEDVLTMVDRIKARGSDQMALATRNMVKRLFDYAMARQVVRFNPAAAIPARFVAKPRSRDRALTPVEVGTLLRGIYASSIRRHLKLAAHLLMLTMVRKTELTDATWDEFDLEAGLWEIPAHRMKQDKSHVVPLAPQAVEMLRELRTLASGSAYVFPSRNTLEKPMAASTINTALRGLDVGVQDFVVHDFRRTASTILHEAGHPSDVIEKCLAHHTGGVRGIYNRAEYMQQRCEMLIFWADFVDSQIDDGRKVIIGRFGKGYKRA